MITRLEIENFYSIKDRHVLDFSVPKTTPEDFRYRKTYDNSAVRTPTVIAFFGANASGKTSVLRAVSFMRHFVTSSFDTYKSDDSIHIQSFACADKYNEFCKLAMEFSVPIGAGFMNADAIRYEVWIDAGFHTKGVAYEALYILRNGTPPYRLFSRERDGDSSKIKAAKEFDLSQSDPRRSVRKNVSLISSLVQFDHKPSLSISNIFGKSFFYNINVGKFQNEEKVVTSFLKDQPEFLKLLNSIIRRIDLGITKVEINTNSSGEPIPMFHHSGLDYPRTFFYESQGTQSFYLNFLDIFAALGAGGVAIMDELDADLHPNLMSELIGWFHSPETNPHNAQLILTCHNASIISDLSKEEVWLAEKNDVGETTVQGVKQFARVRRDANLYSKYMAGEFGGVPRFG